MRVRHLAALAFAFALPASAADAEAGKRKAEACGACHGVDGNSASAEFPSLAAQPPLYVLYQLLNFRDGRRKSDVMVPFAAKLSDDDMKDIAAYFTAQKARAPQDADTAVVAAGKAVEARNHCGSCHMPDFSGQKHIARLAGQHRDYLVKSLKGYRGNTRADLDGTMSEAAQPLSDKDIDDVAAWLSKL
ncbi:MAG TPA: c-type cytochrome [Usitatibacter sp.]